MAGTKLVGQNYTTPDLVAKVTGKAKYAEDFRAEGMLFTKLLLSPMPHARVVRIDTSAAEAMPGVKAILTEMDLPGAQEGLTLGENVRATAITERGLTMEPLYEGEPILAVAAVDELTAAEAIEKIVVEFEPLPFAVDPVESLKPGSSNARTTGNVWMRPPAAAAPQGRGNQAPGAAGAPAAPPAPPPGPEVRELKWTAEDFAAATDGHLPMGEATDEWTVGDIEEGFKAADLVLDETFITPSTSHQPLESRSAMAYWQNGKLFLHGSTQSTVQTVGSVARWVGVKPEEVVMISEYTGGGFGSKIPGAISMAIPALLSKKAGGAPVMMRISREEEHYIGRARQGIHSRVKVGFQKDGRITAVDLFVVGDNGPYDAQGDFRGVGNWVSLCYQPLAMRWRGVTVLTNTPPRTAQRAPGGLQANGLMEPVLAKAARALGIDEVEIHRINAPAGKAPFGPRGAGGKQQYVTSAFMKETLAKGAELFNWEEKKARSGKRQGSKVRGSGVAVSSFNAGSTGFDGLFIIKPDGRVQFQSGIGNLGTHSMFDVHRVAAEMLDVPWEKCDVVFGDTGKHLPWTCVSAGSQTTHAMTRAAHAAASDAIKKLQEIAAKTLGGSPDSYRVAGERVASGGRSMTLAQAAQKAIELGGRYDGHEVPEDVNAFTKRSAAALVGQGLMAVAKDNYKRDGNSVSHVAGFAEVEVDVETGQYTILEFVAVADVGTVLNPRSLQGQTFGGLMLGIGHAIGQKWVYDLHYGVPLAKRFHFTRPPTILDKPIEMKFAALNVPDPETPVGARGIGEAPVGAGFGAIVNAIAAAIGDEVFRRSPVTADIILTSLENGRRVHEPLTTHI
jgi:CO/xanthine dehydrogenase Mo-binding subunit